MSRFVSSRRIKVMVTAALLTVAGTAQPGWAKPDPSDVLSTEIALDDGTRLKVTSVTQTTMAVEVDGKRVSVPAISVLYSAVDTAARVSCNVNASYGIPYKSQLPNGSFEAVVNLTITVTPECLASFSYTQYIRRGTTNLGAGVSGTVAPGTQGYNTRKFFCKNAVSGTFYNRVNNVNQSSANLTCSG
jgi:hypothetical protein